MLGHGGVAVVARAAGVSRVTVTGGVRELEAGDEPLGRTRRCGGGRKSVTKTDPGLKAALLALVEPESRGDPESVLRWTTKSLDHLADELAGQGHKVSAPTVAGLLREENFSLQGNAKTIEGGCHRDRDAQFAHINTTAEEHIAAGQPVISVDGKKKELVGNFGTGGREYRPVGEPVATNVYDFKGELGKVTPYGVYDMAANTGWVSVGSDHDTGAFAVESIRRWWDKVGALAYPKADRLLITADGGGSDGYRLRLCKRELAELATQMGLQITLCHFPPGTSKWNKIEHRLFAQISMNWRGQPLTSHEVIIDLIGATTTRTGLKAHAELDDTIYPTGIKISDTQMAALPITRHEFHGDWNYTLKPEKSE